MSGPGLGVDWLHQGPIRPYFWAVLLIRSHLRLIWPHFGTVRLVWLNWPYLGLVGPYLGTIWLIRLNWPYLRTVRLVGLTGALIWLARSYLRPI